MGSHQLSQSLHILFIWLIVPKVCRFIYLPHALKHQFFNQVSQWIRHIPLLFILQAIKTLCRYVMRITHKFGPDYNLCEEMKRSHQITLLVLSIFKNKINYTFLSFVAVNKIRKVASWWTLRLVRKWSAQTRPTSDRCVSWRWISGTRHDARKNACVTGIRNLTERWASEKFCADIENFCSNKITR